MGLESKSKELVSVNMKKSIYKIGIPRALYFYKFGPLWKAFLTNLGHEVVFSSPTTSKIVEQGSQYATSELCVPMKIYFGHILSLIQSNPDLDYIFIPRYVSTHEEQYFCPKFLALPEAVKYGLNLSIPVLTLEFDVKKQKEDVSLVQFGKSIGHSAREIYQSWAFAQEKFKEFQKTVLNNNYSLVLDSIDSNPKHKVAPKQFKSQISAHLKGKFPLNILVLGHPYNVYEKYINIDLIERLEAMDCTVFTIEKMPEDIFKKPVTINKTYHQYWQTEDEILKTARYFLNEGRKHIDGIIFLISFACGPDSLIQEIVMRDMMKAQIPYLALILDEHSGESGMVTRVQALIEMIRHKKF